MDTCGLYYENMTKLIPRIANSEKRAFMEAALAGFKAVFEAGSLQQPQRAPQSTQQPQNNALTQLPQQQMQPVSQSPTNRQPNQNSDGGNTKSSSSGYSSSSKSGNETKSTYPSLASIAPKWADEFIRGKLKGNQYEKDYIGRYEAPLNVSIIETLKDGFAPNVDRVHDNKDLLMELGIWEKELAKAKEDDKKHLIALVKNPLQAKKIFFDAIKRNKAIEENYLKQKASKH